MKSAGLTNVELAFQERSGRKEFTTDIPYVVVQNFPNLGLLTSLRFLEWAAENPEGVISLPTGKPTPFFTDLHKLFLIHQDTIGILE